MPGIPSLAARLRALGLPPVRRVELHRNELVMLSWKPGVLLRIHEGYNQAPDAVLAAVVRFLKPRVRRATRLAARKEFLAFRVEGLVESRPRRQRIPRLRPGDAPLMIELRRLFDELNVTHFHGTLGLIPLHLSDRMRTRLGELRLDRYSGQAERITLSRRHLRRDGWVAVRETLLHEMVHQWQAETRLPVDHGAAFRQKAMEVGITPRAVRVDF
ncbi:MAG: SprT-like domain-containing protein [Gemmatimonadales bacterium]